MSKCDGCINLREEKFEVLPIFLSCSRCFIDRYKPKTPPECEHYWEWIMTTGGNYFQCKKCKLISSSLKTPPRPELPTADNFLKDKTEVNDELWFRSTTEACLTYIYKELDDLRKEVGEMKGGDKQ